MSTQNKSSKAKEALAAVTARVEAQDKACSLTQWRKSSPKLFVAAPELANDWVEDTFVSLQTRNIRSGK